jgi:hypothetical protein
MIFEVAILSFVLARPPHRCTSVQQDCVLIFDSTNQVLEWSPAHSIIPEVSVTGTLEAALASDFASIGAVRHVLTERADGNVLVWIAIDRAESYEIRSQVYDKELNVMDAFPEISFDFNLVSATERNPREVATGAQVVYTRL